MRPRNIASWVVAILLLGCADMTSTQQRTMSGAAIGTAGGALIGAIGGNTAMGAVIGAAAGATGGYIWDQHKKSEQRAYERWGGGRQGFGGHAVNSADYHERP
jgi:hypothetical protein